MKDSATAFIAVLLAFIYSLGIFKYILPYSELMVLPVLLIGVNTVLHIIYASRGRISLALLPAAWAVCIAPLYIYCQTLANSRVSERSLVFLVLGFAVLAPVFTVSLLTSLVSRFRRR